MGGFGQTASGALGGTSGPYYVRGHPSPRIWDIIGHPAPPDELSNELKRLEQTIRLQESLARHKDVILEQAHHMQELSERIQRLERMLVGEGVMAWILRTVRKLRIYYTG